MIDNNIINEFKIADISQIDVKKTYFHYTSIDNLESISNYGLLPKLGDNSIGVEKSEKIFFTIGQKGTLVLMDSWIKWIIAKSILELSGIKKVDKSIYKFWTFVMKLKIRPQFIINFITKIELNNKIVKKSAYKKMKKILDNSVFFALDLENGVDFSKKDVDEVKSQNFDRTFLKMLYSYDSHVYEQQMEFWNMHTYTGKDIPKSKLTLLKSHESFIANDIIRAMAKSSRVNIKKVLPYLNEYLEFLNSTDKVSEYKLNNSLNGKFVTVGIFTFLFITIMAFFTLLI